MNTSYLSQERRILNALECAGGQFVSMPDLHAVSGSMNISKRVSNLRKRGYHVENKLEHEGQEKHSYYRLLKPSLAAKGTL